jgi:type VI secretion system protein ImpH
MARARRRTTAAVIDRLFDNPRRFDFFQAVRVLERHAARVGRDPRFRLRRPVGHDFPPAEEAVRFRVDPNLSFPAAALVAATPEKDGAPPALTAAFIGLVGPLGVLPQHYSELVTAQNRQRSTALAQFLDLIHHRAVSLFYRAWVKYRPAMAFERADGQDDSFTDILAALTGFTSPSMRGRLAFSDHLVWHFAGLLSAAPRSAAGLEAMLSEVLGRSVTVEPFIGGWIAVDPDSQTRLSSFEQPDGQFGRLGVDAMAGARAWDAQGRFRVKIGPLDYRRFLDFMPGGGEMARLNDVVQLYAGAEFDAEVEVTLQADGVPQSALTAPDDPGGPRLGWNTWLLAAPSPCDRSDAHFRLRVADDGDPFDINEGITAR